MNPRLRIGCLLLMCLLPALLGNRCATTGGGGQGRDAARAPTAPASVTEQVGEGPVKVYGASVYSPGQAIYKELRQQDSLMAFLACQGEPDRLEVVHHPGAPRIVLEYRRRGLSQTGTVEIEASPGGYYTARPINPQGRLPSSSRPASPPKPPRRAPPQHESRPAPPPPTPPAPEPEPEAAPEPPVDEPEPQVPQPSSEQLDDCPDRTLAAGLPGPLRTECGVGVVPGYEG